MNHARSSGSAHAGMMPWLWQRVTAIYLAGFVIYVIVQLNLSPIRNHADWQAWFAIGYVRLAWAIFILSILVHAWIGMRSIYLDYLRPLWLRSGVSLITALGLLALGLWAARILLA